MTTHSNIGRINFTSSSSPANPHVVQVGVLPTSGVKNILIQNVGNTPFVAYGRIGSTDTSPQIQLYPNHTGMIVLVGTATSPAYVVFWKRFDPYFVNMYQSNTDPVNERIAVAEIDAIQG